ncbi:hypothetical protein JCM16814_04750 [Desulfobaculum senezii]
MAEQIPSLMDRFTPQPNWRDTNSYPGVNTPRPRWGWEFIRRNEAYIRAYCDAFMDKLVPASPGRIAPAPEVEPYLLRWEKLFYMVDEPFSPSCVALFKQVFGLTSLLNPRLIKPFRFDSSYDKSRIERVGPSLLTIRLKDNEFLALFDIRDPFKAQVERVKKEFSRRITYGFCDSHFAELVEASKDKFPHARGGYVTQFEEPPQSRQHYKPQRYRQYLQILDAQSQGASRKEVYDFMCPKRRGTTDEPADINEWWSNTTRLAREYRDYRYLEFFSVK